MDSEYAESINFPGDMELLKQFASEQHLALRTTPIWTPVVSIVSPRTDWMDSNYTNVKRSGLQTIRVRLRNCSH